MLLTNLYLQYLGSKCIPYCLAQYHSYNINNLRQTFTKFRESSSFDIGVSRIHRIYLKKKDSFRMFRKNSDSIPIKFQIFKFLLSFIQCERTTRSSVIHHDGSRRVTTTRFSWKKRQAMRFAILRSVILSRQVAVWFHHFFASGRPVPFYPRRSTCRRNYIATRHSCIVVKGLPLYILW